MDGQLIRAVWAMCWYCTWFHSRNIWKSQKESESGASRLLCECHDCIGMGYPQEVGVQVLCLRTIGDFIKEHFNPFRFSERMFKQTELPVYNYIYENNNLTWGKYMSLVRCGLHEPLDKALWYINSSLNFFFAFIRL